MHSLLLRAGLVLSVGASPGVARAAPPVIDEQIAELQDHHRHHQHGGLTQFVVLSLDTLGEAPAHHEAVDQAQDALHTCLAPIEAGEQALLTLVAEGVAAGAVDGAKVKAGVERMTGAGEGVHACVVAPLNRLHAALDAPERAELGDKVRAHWAVWRQENQAAELSTREPGGRLAALRDALGLSAPQEEQLARALEEKPLAPVLDAQGVQVQVESFASAFASQAFDAGAVTTRTTGLLAAHGASRMAHFYQAAAPVLTPAQRATLAAHLREHAEHHPVVATPGGAP